MLLKAHNLGSEETPIKACALEAAKDTGEDHLKRQQVL